MDTSLRSNLIPRRNEGSASDKWVPCLLKDRNRAIRRKLIINKKIMPVAKINRTNFGIFIPDLDDMLHFLMGIKLEQLSFKP